MSHVLTRNAKPGAGTPGFAQSTWLLVAYFHYRIGQAGSNAFHPLLPIALDGAGYGAALLWGGPWR